MYLYVWSSWILNLEFAFSKWNDLFWSTLETGLGRWRRGRGGQGRCENVFCVLVRWGKFTVVRLTMMLSMEKWVLSSTQFYFSNERIDRSLKETNLFSALEVMTADEWWYMNKLNSIYISIASFISNRPYTDACATCELSMERVHHVKMTIASHLTFRTIITDDTSTSTKYTFNRSSNGLRKWKNIEINFSQRRAR